MICCFSMSDFLSCISVRIPYMYITTEATAIATRRYIKTAFILILFSIFFAISCKCFSKDNYNFHNLCVENFHTIPHHSTIVDIWLFSYCIDYQRVATRPLNWHIYCELLSRTDNIKIIN